MSHGGPHDIYHALRMFLSLGRGSLQSEKRKASLGDGLLRDRTGFLSLVHSGWLQPHYLPLVRETFGFSHANWSSWLGCQLRHAREVHDRLLREIPRDL